MDIIVDTVGQSDLANRKCLVDSDDDNFEFEHTAGTSPQNTFDIEHRLYQETSSKQNTRFDATKDIDLDEFEKEMGWKNKKKQLTKKAVNIKQLIKKVSPVEEVLAKSVIKPGFEQLEAVPSYKESVKKQRRERRKERAKTTGEGWFNMRAPEMTPEVRHDLEVINMRAALDPKHFYKKNDHKQSFPKHFHIGKIVDSPLDYYSSRLTKKERKKTIVDELMADAAFAKYNKRKYKEIIDEKKKAHYKAHRHAKKLKGKKGKKK